MAERDSIHHLKQGLDLPSTVEAAGIELERSGSRYVGLCPFHSDQTPSFFVFTDNHFYCFGCGEHGDAIDFVQRLHGCDFKEALKILGIDQGPLSKEQRQEIKRLQHRRELVKAFRQWESKATDEAAMLCRCAWKVLGDIQTEADLDRVGNIYHGLESWQYHLDILVGNDDEAKLGLYHAGYYA